MHLHDNFAPKEIQESCYKIIIDYFRKFIMIIFKFQTRVFRKVTTKNRQIENCHGDTL